MARRRYLMAYDIADPKRLRRICTLMEDNGERLQYSVFLCDLSVAELAELQSSVMDVMHLREVQRDPDRPGPPARARRGPRPRAPSPTARRRPPHRMIIVNSPVQCAAGAIRSRMAVLGVLLSAIRSRIAVLRA